jgi:hypothetical protein
MMKSMVAAGALAIAVSFAGAAQAQSYISDWGIADMRQAVVASGATVTREDNTKDPYIAAKTAAGLKFTITGRVCDGADGAKRCKGALFQTSFTMDSDSEVDIAVKKWAPQFAATSVSNDGSKGLLLSRYMIFDYGIHRDNLRLNLQVFTGIAEDIWGDI